MGSFELALLRVIAEERKQRLGTTLQAARDKSGKIKHETRVTETTTIVSNAVGTRAVILQQRDGRMEKLIETRMEKSRAVCDRKTRKREVKIEQERENRYQTEREQSQEKRVEKQGQHRGTQYREPDRHRQRKAETAAKRDRPDLVSFFHLRDATSIRDKRKEPTEELNQREQQKSDSGVHPRYTYAGNDLTAVFWIFAHGQQYARNLLASTFALRFAQLHKRSHKIALYKPLDCRKRSR